MSTVPVSSLIGRGEGFVIAVVESINEGKPSENGKYPTTYFINLVGGHSMMTTVKPQDLPVSGALAAFGVRRRGKARFLAWWGWPHFTGNAKEPVQLDSISISPEVEEVSTYTPANVVEGGKSWKS
jgi:hypothetical protein